MVETNDKAVRQPDRRHSNPETRGGNHAVSMQMNESRLPCSCLTRWESEGGAVEETIGPTR